jgi:outer membrane protein assembly factor BamB
MVLKPMIRSIFSLLLVLSCTSNLLANDWPKWRGPNDNGTAPAGKYPVSWGETSNILWKVVLPGKGCSTPIVLNKIIYVTGASKATNDSQDALLAFDLSGKELWQTKFGVERAGRHRNASGSNPSPVTDGKDIYVYFKSGNLAAVGLDGKIRWQTNLVATYGPERMNWDYGTSPALTEKLVIMVRMHNGESWVAAFDKQTGEMKWKTDRTYQTPNENDNGYTTPIVLKEQGREQVVIWGGEHVTTYDAADGKLLWSCGGFNPDSGRNWPAVATPVVSGNMMVIPFGRNDRGTPRLFGIKLGGEGDVTQSNHVWKRNDISTFVPTPVEYKGRIYLLRDRGEVECLDPATGNTVWKGEFPRASGNFYSSPVIADGKMYAFREDGSGYVAKIEDKFELISETKLDDRIIATPVFVADRILARGDQNLYCIGTN